MNNIVPSNGIRNLSASSVVVPLIYPASYTSRAASLNSAIRQGIHRSKGLGFKGRERSQARDTGRTYRGKAGVQRLFKIPSKSSARSQLRPGTSQDIVPSVASRSQNVSDKLHISATSYGKELLANEVNHGVRSPRGGRRKARSLSSSRNNSEGSGFPKGDNMNYSTAKTSQRSKSYGNGGVAHSPLSNAPSGYNLASRVFYTKNRYSLGKMQTLENTSQERFRSENNGRSVRQWGSEEETFRLEDGRTLQQHDLREISSNWNQRSPPSRFGRLHNLRNANSPSQARVDSRMPVSIPYTTPASEFLYGSSVVEAALTSRRMPRRKHYKLYIYNGRNRDGVSVKRDAGLERLAMKSGVPVIRVSGERLRVMDKMSGGRPHNGYILETSPLPRKPITSLGELITVDGQSGFRVSLDHQSREEAAINGTDDFIHCSSQILGRKPLVLLLDSIVDPGNLGSIIRTASFLGATAIAVSTRNSASFTPVVLKASAGASENVTLFSVRKPARFLIDSQAAGWKVYAAVAAAGQNDLSVKVSATTDELQDHLSESSSILMLGGEGEGLRTNLRSKADVNLSISGSGQSHNVDSLNVSVAAGILCNFFLEGRNVKVHANTTKDPKTPKVESRLEPAGDLF